MPASDTPGEPAMPVLTSADLKRVVAEALRDNRDWIREVVQEALEECASGEARREAEFRAALADPHVAFPPSEGHA
ncbi:MAG TPA: hypothetical protein VF594_09800 [Rubricoccaceae bacterium]|jgi:hypothetical protein